MDVVMGVRKQLWPLEGKLLGDGLIGESNRGGKFVFVCG